MAVQPRRIDPSDRVIDLGAGVAERLGEVLVARRTVGIDRAARGVVHRRVGLGRVHRRVGVRERDHQQQRPIGVALLEEGQGLVADPRRGVRGRVERIGLGQGVLVVEAPVGLPAPLEPVVVVVEPTGPARVLHVGVEVLAQPHVVEPVVGAHRVEVHLADQRGLVAGGAEGVGHREGALLERERRGVGRTVVEQARHQRRARRHARGGPAVGVGEDHPGRSEGIEVGGARPDRPRVADLVEPLLVGHDQDQVGPAIAHRRPASTSSTMSKTCSTRCCHEWGRSRSRSSSGRPAARWASIAATKPSASSATVMRSPKSGRLATGVDTTGTPAEAYTNAFSGFIERVISLSTWGMRATSTWARNWRTSR